VYLTELNLFGFDRMVCTFDLETCDAGTFLSVENSPPLAAAMVIVLPGAHELEFSELRNQVLELMKKIEKSVESVS
jgi:hypothetical protein